MRRLEVGLRANIADVNVFPGRATQIVQLLINQLISWITRTFLRPCSTNRCTKCALYSGMSNFDFGFKNLSNQNFILNLLPWEEKSYFMIFVC